MLMRRVPEHHLDIVERLGRYHRTLGPGRHWLVPGIDRVRARVDLREDELSLTVPVIAADNVVLSVGLVLRYAIVDPVRSVYRIHNVPQGLQVVATVALRSAVGVVTAATALDDRDEINGQVSRLVDETEAIRNWGVQVRRIEITSIAPGPVVTDVE